jgi:hypothetical protein
MKAIDYLKNFSDTNSLKKEALKLLEKEKDPNAVEVYRYIEEAGELVSPDSDEALGITLHPGMGIVDLWEAEVAYVPELPQGHPAARMIIAMALDLGAAIDNDKYQDMSKEEQSKASDRRRVAAWEEAKKAGVKIKTFISLFDEKPEEDMPDIKIIRQLRALVV